MNNFVHLHGHSEYSMQDGVGTIKDIVLAAVKNKMRSVALTEHGYLFSTPKFWLLCKANNVKPILGVEAYVQPEDPSDKGSHHLVLIAKNRSGFENLKRICSYAATIGYRKVPRV